MTSLQDRQPTIIVLFPAGAWISLFSKPSRPTVEPIKSLQEQIRWHRSSAPERILTFTRGWLQSEYSEILLPLALIGSSAGAERVNAIRGCHSERYFIREKYTAILRQPTNVFISYFFSNMINCVITVSYTSCLIYEALQTLKTVADPWSTVRLRLQQYGAPPHFLG